MAIGRLLSVRQARVFPRTAIIANCGYPAVYLEPVQLRSRRLTSPLQRDRRGVIRDRILDGIVPMAASSVDTTTPHERVAATSAHRIPTGGRNICAGLTTPSWQAAKQSPRLTIASNASALAATSLARYILNCNYRFLLSGRAVYARSRPLAHRGGLAFEFANRQFWRRHSLPGPRRSWPLNLPRGRNLPISVRFTWCGWINPTAPTQTFPTRIRLMSTVS